MNTHCNAMLFNTLLNATYFLMKLSTKRDLDISVTMKNSTLGFYSYEESYDR